MNKFNFASLLFLVFILSKTYTNTQIISVGGMVFTPTPVSVTVGDTIKWVWANGFHTTTSTTIPAGALPWNAPIDSAHPGFNYIIAAAGQYNYQCNFHYVFGMVGTINASPIGIKIISGNVPEKFALYQNYPNPFNPSTNINFDIAEKGVVKITIYDITSSEIKTLVNEELDRDSYSVIWDAANFSSGTYFYKLETKDFIETKKMILVK
jgi:plastocyanin